MTASKEFFYRRTDKSHIQYSQMNDFLNKCKNGEAISGVDEEELEQLVSDLSNDDINYSNDMVIDMILKCFVKNTNDNKLKKLLNDINIGNVDYSNIIGKSYGEFYDKSPYCEIGRDIDKRIRLFCDLVATFIFSQEKLADEEENMFEQRTLWELMIVNIDRVQKNEEYTNEYNLVQLLMMQCDMVFKDGFTDRYIEISREMNEVALCFLICHEIAHLYYGHKKCNDKSKNKDMEFLADEFAVKRVLEYIEWGFHKEALHLFSAIYIIFFVSSFYWDINEEQENHPSLNKRIDKVNNIIEGSLNRNSYEIVMDYVKAMRVLTRKE